MADRSHLYFRNPSEGQVAFRSLVRAVFAIEEEERTPDYRLMQRDFGTYRATLIRDRDARYNARSINDLQHVDYIEIHFFGPYDYEKFAPRYRNNFGLVPVKFEKFNTKLLFAVVDNARFREFLDQLQIFITARDHTGQLPYNVDVRYIREFYLLTSEKIIRYDALYDTVLLNLVDSDELHVGTILPIESRLQEYLRAQNITYSYNPSNRTIQIWAITQAALNVILNNFDIVHSVNSSLSGVIRPGPFGLPVRTFGFTITPPAQDAPSIGIIDTGVSNQTPLSSVILNANNQYDLIGGGSHADSHQFFGGHGTAVAAFATLGRKLIPDHAGNKQADAWIISIKILGGNNSRRVADVDILSTIREVNRAHGTRIFVLTVMEQAYKKTDDAVSPFAYSLDLLAHELDILIFISAGNVHPSFFFDVNSGAATHRYPNDFIREHTNIKSPAESMNNLTVGACADNFEDVIGQGIAVDGTFPAIYTSKFHYNYHDGILKSKQRNLHVKKPDIIFNGGDWDVRGEFQTTGLKQLSARNGEYFAKETGTSFSAGLIANLAVLIERNYPELRSQSIKALIINSASIPSLSNFFDELPKTVTSQVIGCGIPNAKECLYSDNNSVTMILEDEISPDTIKAFDINIPEYMLEKENKSTVLDVTMTLCFSFSPVLNNQMAYCPVHIAFGLFKNMPLHATRSTADENGEEVIEYIGINRNKTENIQIKGGQSWSEDYYFKMKLLSNTQKLSLVFDKENIRSNENKFKLAVKSIRHKLLDAGQMEYYNTAHKFSLVINVKERPLNGKVEGNLYNEMIAINTLVAIADLEAEAEA